MYENVVVVTVIYLILQKYLFPKFKSFINKLMIPSVPITERSEFRKRIAEKEAERSKLSCQSDFVQYSKLSRDISRLEKQCETLPPDVIPTVFKYRKHVNSATTIITSFILYFVCKCSITLGNTSEIKNPIWPVPFSVLNQLLNSPAILIGINAIFWEAPVFKKEKKMFGLI